MSNGLQREVDPEVLNDLAFYKRWAGIWWSVYVVFGVGGIVTSGLASAFNVVHDSNNVVGSAIALVGSICAGSSALLTPEKRADWFSKGRDHLKAAVVRYRMDEIEGQGLTAALARAAALVRGEP